MSFIGCVCPTFKRPNLLGRAIHCFLQQTHTNSYLVVVDDAGQYQSQEHERWKLVSTKQRYNSLGGKRQAGIKMLPCTCEGYMCWDDDDVYFPHAIESVSRALGGSAWAQCRHVYDTLGPNELVITKAFGTLPGGREIWGYGGCWAYRLDEHRTIGGYPDDPARSSNDDVDLAMRFHARYGPSADSSSGRPWYWYNRDPGVTKVSDEGKDFWRKRGKVAFTTMQGPPIGWNGPNLYNYRIANEPPRPLGWQEDEK